MGRSDDAESQLSACGHIRGSGIAAVAAQVRLMLKGIGSASADIARLCSGVAGASRKMPHSDDLGLIYGERATRSSLRHGTNHNEILAIYFRDACQGAVCRVKYSYPSRIDARGIDEEEVHRDHKDSDDR